MFIPITNEAEQGRFRFVPAPGSYDDDHRQRFKMNVLRTPLTALAVTVKVQLERPPRATFSTIQMSEVTGLRFEQLSRYYKNQSAALAMIF